jgi:uncharacterized membrane protein
MEMINMKVAMTCASMVAAVLFMALAADAAPSPNSAKSYGYGQDQGIRTCTSAPKGFCQGQSE